MRVLAVAWLSLLVGCPRAATTTTDVGLDDAAPTGECPRLRQARVELTTDDDQILAADLTTVGKRGAPGVILLHMIPPANDRSNYSASFIQALASRGLNVLNVDRRGAGESSGDPKRAY
ncbi:MAG: hypothetical protein AAGA56_24935, partial [Myxococcota bacterium]